jgi:hypothetical protein
MFSNNLMDFKTFTICTNMSAGSPKATKGIDRSSTYLIWSLFVLSGGGGVFHVCVWDFIDMRENKSAFCSSNLVGRFWTVL